MTLDKDAPATELNPQEPQYSGWRMNADSARNFRQEIEREYRAEIRQLREERVQQERLINELRAEVVELQHWKDEISQPIEAATVIVNAGIMVKYLIIAIIGLTSAIGGITMMSEAMKSWFAK